MQFFATKKKVPDSCNAEEHYQSFLRKKNTKTSHKLCKNEKVSQIGSNSSLYNDTKIVKIF